MVIDMCCFLDLTCSCQWINLPKLRFPGLFAHSESYGWVYQRRSNFEHTQLPLSERWLEI
jgi:hypothetical protein